jgi:hypothetical protein
VRIELRHSSAQRQYIAPTLSAFQKYAQSCIDSGAWLQVQGMVVCGAHGISWTVCKLQFNMLARLPEKAAPANEQGR